MASAPSGPGNTPTERAACLARARQLYSEADIQAFLADSPGDECRLLTGALAPTPGALAGDPWTAARSAPTPGSDIPTDPVLRAAYFAGHPGPTPYVVAPSSITPTVPVPLALVAPLVAPPATLPASNALVLTAPPGGGSVPVPSPAAAPPMLAGLADNKLLLLALAVAAYFVFVRR